MKASHGREPIIWTTDTETVHEPELEQVELWRQHSLLRAGYDPESAALVARAHKVGLHDAVELARHGCPIQLTLRILL